MASAQLEQIYQMVDSLSEQERQLLLEHITGSSQVETQPSQEDVTYTEAELAALLEPEEPLTGRQIVEKGLLGGWKDLGIEDSVEWLEQQRAKRRNKHQW